MKQFAFPLIAMITLTGCTTELDEQDRALLTETRTISEQARVASEQASVEARAARADAERAAASAREASERSDQIFRTGQMK